MISTIGMLLFAAGYLVYVMFKPDPLIALLSGKPMNNRGSNVGITMMLGGAACLFAALVMLAWSYLP